MAPQLTPFQLEVAHLFFALPSAGDFLLAGGAALLAQRLTSRPTQDLDFFTRRGEDVIAVRDELEVAAAARGWTVTRVRNGVTFCRLVVHGEEDLLVDIALDSPPSHPASESVAGPTFAPAELAARKLLALFDRGAARDFADVFVLTRTFGTDGMLADAQALDAGMTKGHLAEQIGSLRRFTDAEVPIDAGEVPAVRAFFASWSEQLRDTDAE